MVTYIDNNKFQFITDFSKYECKNTSGEDIILDFGELSIYERIMLSSYLTLLCDSTNKNVKTQNLFDKIFNFNNEKRRVKYLYQDAFIEDLTLFLKQKPIYFSFLKNNFDKIENDKTFIYRQQLNASEMEVLYSLQFRRSYKSLMNMLYIIGVSKQNIKTVKLNKISLKNFYESSISMSKKRVEEIFRKINEKSKNVVKYKIYNGFVYFGNGFEIELESKYSSLIKNEEDILDSFNSDIEEDKVTEVKIEKPVALDKEGKIVDTPKLQDEEISNLVLKEENNNTDYTPFNFGDGYLTKEVIKNYILENKIKLSNIFSEEDEERKKVIRKFLSSETYEKYLKPLLINQTKEDKIIYDVYHGNFIPGEDGLEKKNLAILQIKEYQSKVLKGLSKIFDADLSEDKKVYTIVLNYICKNFDKLFINF